MLLCQGAMNDEKSHCADRTMESKNCGHGGVTKREEGTSYCTAQEDMNGERYGNEEAWTELRNQIRESERRCFEQLCESPVEKWR